MRTTTIKLLNHASLWLLFILTGIAYAAGTLQDTTNQTPSAPVFKVPPDKPLTADVPVTKKPARVTPPPGPALMAPKSGGAPASAVPLMPDASKLRP